MGGHCSGVSHKLGDWTTPPGTTRRKLEPGGGTLSQRRHPLRKCLHSSPPADFPGARDSKNLPGEEQTPPLPFRQLMGTFTDAVFTDAPVGLVQCGATSLREGRSRAGRSPHAGVPPARDAAQRVTEPSARQTSPHTARQKELCTASSVALPPHSLPASQVPRLREDAHSPFSGRSTISSEVPVPCPSPPRTPPVSADATAPLLIAKVSQQRVTALRALARVRRAAPSPSPSLAREPPQNPAAPGRERRMRGRGSQRPPRSPGTERTSRQRGTRSRYPAKRRLVPAAPLP